MHAHDATPEIRYISLAVPPAMHDALRQAAADSGVSLTKFVRQVLLEAAQNFVTAESTAEVAR